MSGICIGRVFCMTLVSTLFFANWSAHAQNGQGGSFASPGAEFEGPQIDGKRPYPAEFADRLRNEMQVEVIRERYPDGSIKVERQVIQDKDFNYVNHGRWTMWNRDGVRMGDGEYWQGKRHGHWVRWYPETDLFALDDESELLGGAEFAEFERPFVSETTFVEGKLAGPWVISDASGRKIVSWEFQGDELHGKAVWCYPNGNKRREIQFDNGVLDGRWFEWSPEQELVKEALYVDGRRRGAYNETYPSGEKYCEGWYLFAAEKTKLDVDWWQGRVDFEIVGQHGQDEKHGLWTYWHRNGKKLSEGEFFNGRRMGRHTWWYENGQKQAEGMYADGQQDGPWTWWYENGQKQMEGEFVAGQQVGLWLSWHENGKTDQVHELSTQIQEASELGRQQSAPKISDTHSHAGEGHRRSQFRRRAHTQVDRGVGSSLGERLGRLLPWQ